MYHALGSNREVPASRRGLSRPGPSRGLPVGISAGQQVGTAFPQPGHRLPPRWTAELLEGTARVCPFCPPQHLVLGTQWALYNQTRERKGRNGQRDPRETRQRRTEAASGLPEPGEQVLGPGAHSLLFARQRVGADPRAGDGEPGGQVEGRQERGQRALQQVRVAAHGVLRLAQVRALGEETHVAG